MIARGAASALALVLLLAGCTAGSGRADSNETCLTQPTATVKVGTGSARPVTRTMHLTVPVGQTVSVTYVGRCLGGARLMVSKPGPGSGLNAFSETVAEGQPVQQWKPLAPGTRNLMVGWSCSGPIPCPPGFIGIVTVTSPKPAG